MRGLYIHVPFCASKCDYCDFYSLPNRNESVGNYIEAVFKEARKYRDLHFDTIYVGGGTPSYIGSISVRELLLGVLRVLRICSLLEGTLEVNPDSTTPELLQGARYCGINRISIGVQSLCEYELLSVGRIHSPTRARDAIKQAIDAGFHRVSADVIVGLPGQSWETLHHTLHNLVLLSLGHISLYLMSVEDNTPLAMNPPPDLPSEDVQAELYEQAREYLCSQGFYQYEISNFALPGQECLHNLNYWRSGEYVGLGPAAASHLNGQRFKNLCDLDAYLANPTGATEELEELTPRAKLAEEAMLRLRLINEGLRIDDMVTRVEHKEIRELRCRLDSLESKGLLLRNSNAYTIPPARVLTSNPIFAQVLAT